MSPNLQFLKKLDKFFITKVKISNGELIHIEGKGCVAIYTKVGIKFIRNVLYVPKISCNLLSVEQLL